MLAAAVFAAPAAAAKEHKDNEKTHPKKEQPSISDLWNDPGDIPSRDLLDGPGGKEHQPRGPMTFVKEDLSGSNPKFDLKDSDGEKWKAKLGVEAQPETAAVRLLWAVGYFADDDYYEPQIKIGDMPELKRGGKVADPDGDVHNLRLKYRPGKKAGTWKWDHNPFIGTRQFNGLRVMMALINNWDLKDVNNAIYKERNNDGGREVYLVSDVGASFGTTGYHYYGGWSKNNVEAYSHSRFITHIHSHYVDFSTPTHPPLVYIFQIQKWIRHERLRKITKQIPRADAKWIGSLLAQLTPQQIRDAFRAAGYDDAQIETLASTLQARIAQLNQL